MEKVFFQLSRLPQSIFVLGNASYWGLESAMCPIFVKPVLEIFSIVYRYLGNVFPVRQRAIYTQIIEKYLLEKENLRAFFRGYKGNHTIRYFFKLEAIFEDVKIKIYAKHRILNIIFFLNKNET